MNINCLCYYLLFGVTNCNLNTLYIVSCRVIDVTTNSYDPYIAFLISYVNYLRSIRVY